MTITELMKQRGMNLAELSRLMGVPYRTAENWKTGAAKPNKAAQKFIEYLGDDVIFNRALFLIEYGS